MARYVGTYIQLLGVLLFFTGVFVVVQILRGKKKSGKDTSNSRGTKKATGKQAQQPSYRYSSTSIVHDKNACEAVKAIGNNCFLDIEKNIPLLPLSGCKASTCNCKYVRHEDRREYDDDRRLPMSLQTDLYDSTGKVNRRQEKRGRRKSDWV